ncbi:MAG: hypothetical protein A4E23_00118 [Methanomethylovorans sp. PtaU1.Bin073]|nr:MAG: hypothetical protein A4E23_00118 [Methanomethylovorans sp. PtaU1.Bin073]
MRDREVVWTGDSPKATLLVLESNTVKACSAFCDFAISCISLIVGIPYSRIAPTERVVSIRIMIIPITEESAVSHSRIVFFLAIFSSLIE